MPRFFQIYFMFNLTKIDKNKKEKMLTENNRNQALVDKLIQLKKERNAVILAHNYQLGEVQDMADFVGDSLDLSRKAAKTRAEVIVFCGVQFMAETASILSPDKIVLLPDINAGCPMANMVTVEKLKEKKQKYGYPYVVCYVNSAAEVKAESDVCCTSANAVKIVRGLDQRKKVLFIPDQYLGHYVSSQVGKEMILWPGYCPTHLRILPQDITRLRKDHPQAKVIVHAECRPEVISLADEVQSTGVMCRYAKTTENNEIIVGTELGIIHRLRKENPEKKFFSVSEQAICPNMKLITLEKVVWSLKEMRYQIKVPARIANRARKAVDRMLELT